MPVVEKGKTYKAKDGSIFCWDSCGCSVNNETCSRKLPRPEGRGFRAGGPMSFADKSFTFKKLQDLVGFGTEALHYTGVYDFVKKDGKWTSTFFFRENPSNIHTNFWESNECVFEALEMSSLFWQLTYVVEKSPPKQLDLPFPEEYM